MEKGKPKPRSTGRGDFSKPRTPRGEFAKPRTPRGDADRPRTPRGDFDKPRTPRGEFAKPRTPRGDFDRPRTPRSDFDKPRRFGSDEFGAPRPASRFRSEDRGDASDPYSPAKRPAPRDREDGGRSFTVNLDPDVARVFRGDASVNKALRLVMQLTQVVQGPPRTPYGDREGARPARRPYEGSAEARGFERKPRFDPDETAEDEA